MCILYNQRDATYTMFFIIINALHVSGGFSAHHQELRNCICSLGYCHDLLLSTAYVDGLEPIQPHQRSTCFGRFFRPSSGAYKLYVQPWILSCFPAVYRRCGWVGSNPTTPAVDSRKAWQYPRLHIQFISSWWWAEKPPQTCRALIIIKNIV
jgi:hypothetical protein